MKLSILLLTLFLAACGTGRKAADDTLDSGTTVRGVSTLLAENPEMLRETVIDVIGEGEGADEALDIIGRYEADLGFVLGARTSGATIADTTDSPVRYRGQDELANRYQNPDAGRGTVTSSPERVRIDRFVRNSLSVAMIGLNECYVNFNETGEDRCARRGLAHGYIALISNPSPAQKTDVIEKIKFLQAPLLK